jgi:hypothetical protein
MRATLSSAEDGSFVQTLLLEVGRMIAGARRALFWWAAITGFALIFAIGAPDGMYRQFAIGIVLASTSLFVLLSLFEIVWRIVRIMVA